MKERAVDPRPFVILALFALLLAALLVPSPASGLVLPMSAEELGRLSSRVFTAEVESVHSRLDAEEGIVTEVLVRRDTAFKGSVGETVLITLPGGRVGDVELVVSETPRFSAGEQVVLFLDAAGSPVGGPQGAQRLRAGRVAESGESLAAFESRVTGAPLATTGRDSLADSLGLGRDASVAGAADGAADPDDDATLSALGDAVAAAPVVGSVSPPAAPAGIGAVVKITGSGFGAQGVASAVEFSYRGSTPIVATGSDIVTWSDTQVQVKVPAHTVNNYPASASSGPIVVVTAAGTRSAGHPFSVTFGYGKAEWPDPTQRYHIWENTADYVGEGALVRAAADTWGAASSFSLAYQGTVSSASSGNARNEVWWEDSGQNGVLAQARYWMMAAPYDPDRPTRQYHITEADVIFNDYYHWGAGTPATYDIQSVALHELGHWLSLRDLYGDGDGAKVMYGSCSSGVQKRALHDADLAGVRWIYDDFDVTPPVTTISGVPAAWTRDTVTVTLSATDDRSAFTTYYRLDGGTIRTYDAPFTIDAEGATEIRYWSVDEDNNTETARTAVARIDRTPPTTAIGGPATDWAPSSVDIEASDPLSGVGSITYRVDGGAPVTASAIPAGSGTWSVTVPLAEPGTRTIEAWAADTAGTSSSATPVVREVVISGPLDIAVERVAGNDRYATAVTVSATTFEANGADTVVLATGREFADALSASGLAGAYGGPLLLSRPDDVPDSVMGELARLGASRVVVVGGEAALGDAVVSELSSAGLKVERLAGRTRYDTAALVAQRIREVAGTPTGVFVARGDDFADALAAAPYAYARAMPILLVRPTSVPSATEEALADLRAAGTVEAVLAGGDAAIREPVSVQVADSGFTVYRVFGPNRYATAAALADHAVASRWVVPSVIGVTTGEDFPDALGGGVAIGANGGAVVLTRGSSLHAEAHRVLYACGPDLSTVRVFGGESAVSASVVEEIKAIWNLP